MRKQNQTQSEHYKMYKKGKQWLFALVTLFGVGITTNLTTVHAATDSGQPAEEAASPTSNPTQAVSLTTGSASGVATAASAPASQPASGDAASTDSGAKSITASSTTSTETQQKSAASQATASDQKMATSTAPDVSVASQTSTQAASSTASEQVPVKTAVPTAVRMNTVADGIERVSLLATDAVSAADQPTAPTLTGAPSLSNFYVNGATVTYNQSTTLSLNHIYNPSGSQQLYGVYVVLPPSVMGASLSVIQQAANNLVTTMQNEKYSIASMTVYQLPNSVSGREVYYLRPNDGANAAGAITAVGFDFPIQTGLATDPTVPVSWQMNANTNDQLIANTVMFAGASNYTSGGNYPTVSATAVGIIGAVDQNVQGIVYSGIARSFSYKHSTIVDTYNVIDGTTGKQITSKAVQGLDGSSYSRATPSTGTNANAVDTLASLGLSSTTYDQASMTINSGTFSDTKYFSGDTTGTGSSFPGST